MSELGKQFFHLGFFKKFSRYSVASFSAFCLDILVTFFLSASGLSVRLNFLFTGLLVTSYLYIVNAVWVFAGNLSTWRKSAPRFLVVSIINIALAQLALSAIIGWNGSDTIGSPVVMRIVVLLVLSLIKFFVLNRFVFESKK